MTTTIPETRLINIMRELLKTYGYFVDHLWHVEDIHFICEQKQLSAVTNEEAMEVFAIAHEQFDGETGISWPQLESALHIFLKRKAVLSLHEKNPA